MIKIKDIKEIVKNTDIQDKWSFEKAIKIVLKSAWYTHQEAVDYSVSDRVTDFFMDTDNKKQLESLLRYLAWKEYNGIIV